VLPRIDLNADLAEGEPYDAEILAVVTSAGLAAGFHAGDPELLLDTARHAVARGVAIGAHPSYDDRDGFGRRDLDVPATRLVADLVYQVGAVEAAARAAGGRLAFVKPHGALYNRAAVDAGVADAVVEAVGLLGGIPLLGLAGSVLVDRAGSRGAVVYGEGFADRAYRPDGTLVPRREPGAVLTDPEAVAAQAVALATTGAAGGAGGRIASICVHGDTPGAVDLARTVRAALEAAGVEVAGIW
jgi:UPF0271 protein